MSTSTHSPTNLPRLRDLPVSERASALAGALNLTDATTAALRQGLTLEQADRMIENVVATYALPLGIVTNFIVNGREVLIPMAVEEPSVVAGCSFAAKIARAGGGYTARSSDPIMIGQMQVLDVPDMEAAQRAIQAASAELMEWLNVHNPATSKNFARTIGFETRVVGPPEPAAGVKPMLILHVLLNVGDAMGANMVNTACEALTPRIEALTGGRVHLRILSNLADRRLVHASCSIPASTIDPLSASGSPISLAQRIVEASLFAEWDPYRAATHNKGVMNGIDAVAIATGNDWRAIEAGAHAYAARSGRYTSLTRWRLGDSSTGSGRVLTGEIEMPLAAGTVGGATRAHPSAQSALKIMGVSTARELAEIMACVGLAQNFAAIRALADEGIQRGHMTLHARQIAMSAGAAGEQIERVADQMVQEKLINLDRAREIVAELPGKQAG